jgi:exopolysaccharide biosynthesis polyprenyl glycosylphosphotransferase
VSAAPVAAETVPVASVVVPDDFPPTEIRPGVQRLELSRRSRQVMRLHLVRALLRTTVLACGDLFVLMLVSVGASSLLAPASLRPFWVEVLSLAVPRSVLHWPQIAVAVLLGLFILDAYGPGDRRRDATRIMAGTALGVGLPYWSSLWSSFSFLALPGYAVTATVIGIALTGERYFINWFVKRFWPEGAAAARALVVGRADDVHRVIEHPALADRRMFTICGNFDVTRLKSSGSAAGVQALCKAIRRRKADTLVMGGSMDDDAFGVVVDAAAAAGCQVLALTRAFSVGGVEPKVVWLHRLPLVQLLRPSFHWRQLFLKRTLDIVGALAALAILWPVLATVALVVRFSSRGPILFRQRRVGLGGRLFDIVKFRSMVVNAEAQRAAMQQQSIYLDARLFKVRNDPRVTRVGAFLRKTSLDELPQLWNVLKGEMSFVGPRPPLPSEVDQYEEHHYARFDVKPGITGPWQASGRNEITDFEQIIELETAYIREWSIWKDVEILLRTIPVVLSARGAH